MAFTQPATFDELWSDERVKSHLLHQPPAGENADFNALYTAYKHMRANDFARFIDFFWLKVVILTPKISMANHCLN